MGSCCSSEPQKPGTGNKPSSFRRAEMPESASQVDAMLVSGLPRRQRSQNRQPGPNGGANAPPQRHTSARGPAVAASQPPSRTPPRSPPRYDVGNSSTRPRDGETDVVAMFAPLMPAEPSADDAKRPRAGERSTGTAPATLQAPNGDDGNGGALRLANASLSASTSALVPHDIMSTPRYAPEAVQHRRRRTPTNALAGQSPSTSGHPQPHQSRTPQRQPLAPPLALPPPMSPAGSGGIATSADATVDTSSPSNRPSKNVSFSLR